MKAYTLKEISKKISVTPSIVKQWEKDLEGILLIPRTKQGARYFTETEVEFLQEIKELYKIHSNKDSIRELLKTKIEPPAELVSQAVKTSLAVISEESDVPAENEKDHQERFFAAMDTYKQTFLNEVKTEIRNVVQKEVVNEVKKEISTGMLHTVKSLSDSIYKSGAATQAEIAVLKKSVDKTAVETSQKYKSISDNIQHQALQTSEEIYYLSKQLSETSEELSHYIDVTNNGIDSLTEVLAKERENYVEDLEQFRQEIRQREVAFQAMLSGFREAAPIREKKWWKFW